MPCHSRKHAKRKRKTGYYCSRCNFFVPEKEFKLFGECGQCGSKKVKKYRV